MDEEKRIQYHDGYCAAVKLELRENREDLVFEEEFKLNSLPRRIDMLVIHKNTDSEIRNGLGRIFKKINLWEMKGPGSSLGIPEYRKMMSYCYQYLSEKERNCAISDVTLSFMRKGKPQKLIAWLISDGFTVYRFQNGIYHIRREKHPDMQIIVIRELDPEDYRWASILRSTAEDLKKANELAPGLQNRDEMYCAARVLELLCEIEKKEGKNMGYIVDLVKRLDEKDAELEQRGAELEQKDAELEQKDVQIDELQKEITLLREQLSAQA